MFRSPGIQAWIVQIDKEKQSEKDDELHLRRAFAWSEFSKYQALEVLVAPPEKDIKRIAATHEGLEYLVDPLTDATIISSDKLTHFHVVLSLAPFARGPDVLDEEVKRTLDHGRNIRTHLHYLLRQ